VSYHFVIVPFVEKRHGAPFGAYVDVGWRSFNFKCGESLVKKFRSSERVTRTFCGECGSNLQFIPDGLEGFALAVAALDCDPLRKPTSQIWVKSKAVWWDLQDEPRCFLTEPPRR